MIKNYFLVAWRNIRRNKVYSTINISGLALGLACSLLIMLWVQDERSVDGFHANGDDLYQVYIRRASDGKAEAGYLTQGLLAGELKRNIPEIQHATGLEAIRPYTFEREGNVQRMMGSFADGDFFRMFSYPLLAGSPATALATTESVAISRKMAETFFGSPAAAIGKLIRYENRDDLRVSGVFENVPANSTLQFDFLRSWAAYVKENRWVENWANTSPASFVQLQANADAAKAAAKIRKFLDGYLQENGNVTTELELQPYEERYLHSTFRNGEIVGGRIEYVRLFTIVSCFILLIACINFMNLSTARAAKRAKEVGVRKVVGASRFALAGQFAGEAVLLAAFAVIIAVTAVVAFLPAFNLLTGKQLALPVDQPLFWVLLSGLMLITGLIAGSYPAIFLSSLKPVQVLKGSLKFSTGGVIFRRSLVVFQFALSIMLIVGMIVIYRQMDYFQSRNLGYDRENLVYLPIEGELAKNYPFFKERAASIPGVLHISKMRNSPTYIEHHTNGVSWPGKDPALETGFADAVVGYDFVKTLDLQLKEGRDFSREYGMDSASFILNEAAAAITGYTDPVGQPISWGGRQGKIIGVLKDFHFNSMHHAIEPLIIRLDENWTWGTIMVRVQAGKTKEALAGLEKLCRSVNPHFPFSYQFSDEEYLKLYKSEQIVSRLSGYFAFLGIFISCLGLFGLATFMAEQRMKEIGVRKVLGASAPDIFVLLSANFLKPVLIAIILASPMAWYAMERWLDGFAYKNGMEWWVLVLAGSLTVFTAMLTVSMQSIKAALMNPVKSLKAA
ncbi:ABC transporter permease [Chitinophaga sp. XS-30]|uniref:ABC transporter permease n=1 Tax=Chitinophaga sp. XS-30 TaxID=2604421 RepID=UPI0011DD9145|nr:ABC transporter permease [Chitinophaga sp. XS-30]QEH42919.1 FtsX-like permease family protein [Chitinophaga sp. XS-30]